jgi:hypothetical protein
MPIVHDSVKTTTWDATLDTIDSGSGNPTGRMYLCNSGGGTLAFLAMSATAFAASSIVGTEAKAVSNTITSATTGVVPGTIARIKFANKSGTYMLDYSAGESSAEIIVADADIIVGVDTIVCNGVELFLAFA